MRKKLESKKFLFEGGGTSAEKIRVQEILGLLFQKTCDFEGGSSKKKHPVVVIVTVVILTVVIVTVIIVTVVIATVVIVTVVKVTLVTVIIVKVQGVFFDWSYLKS